MSSSALRVVAILLAIGAAILGYVGFKSSQDVSPATEETAQPEVMIPQSPVLIAARDIKAKQPLSQEDVTVFFVDNPIPKAYQTPQQVMGLTPRMPIAVGDMLLPEHFQTLSAVTANIAPGERAIAIKVDEVTGAGGYIKPGDRVDVVLFLPAGHETGKNSTAQLLLPAIKVLAYGDELEQFNPQEINRQARAYQSDEMQPFGDLLGDSKSKNNIPDSAAKQSKTALLAVDKSVISTLMLAESTGRIRLALVGQEIDESTEAKGPSDYYVSTKALIKGEAAETLPSPPAIEAVAPKPVLEKPVGIYVHRGNQQSVIHVGQEQ